MVSQKQKVYEAKALPFWLCCKLSYRHCSACNRENLVAVRRFLCTVYRPCGTERFDLPHNGTLNFQGKEGRTNVEYIFTFTKKGFELVEIRYRCGF